jgi:TetR/AcrR family transcriptional regulator
VTKKAPTSSERVPEPLSSRDKILDVAEAHFARAGFGGVGMREIASEAGLGKSSLFHHFPSKNALYFEVVERTLERIARAVEPAPCSDRSATERLSATSDAMVDALAEHPTTAPLLLRSLFEMYPLSDDVPPEGHAVDAILKRLIDQFQCLVRDGIASGEFREVSVPDTTQTLIGAAVFHFASGDFGEDLFGGASLFSAKAVKRRRVELREFFLHALTRNPI